MPFVLFAFNTSFNKRTGFTPFWINHGFEANLPGQIPMTLTATENKNETKISPSSYCANLITNMQQAFQLVQQNLTQANLQHPNIQDIPHTFQILKTMKSFTSAQFSQPMTQYHSNNSGKDLIK